MRPGDIAGLFVLFLFLAGIGYAYYDDVIRPRRRARSSSRAAQQALGRVTARARHEARLEGLEGFVGHDEDDRRNP